MAGRYGSGDWGRERFDRLVSQADIDRAAREAGHKSLLRRLYERLWPSRRTRPDSQQDQFGGPGL